MRKTDRAKLTTERPNPVSRNIDSASTLEIVDIINSQDALVAAAVGRERKRIAQAVLMIAEAFAAGGRLFYVGAGTSGRLGVLDAAECPPTFGTRPSQVQGIIAGGRGALVRSVEGAEDDPAAGAERLEKAGLSPRDVVCGIAACGMTPFVRGAVAYARKLGCATLFVTCAPEARGHVAADVVINPVVGPEVLTGSTRMKAGTATKLVLNTLTTAAMIKRGKVYGNLMVDLVATNQKLSERSERIVMATTGLSRRAAKALLERARGRVKLAILMHDKKLSYRESLRLLDECDGFLGRALEESP